MNETSLNAKCRIEDLSSFQSVLDKHPKLQKRLSSDLHPDFPYCFRVMWKCPQYSKQL